MLHRSDPILHFVSLSIVFQVKNEGTLPAMLTWGMQDANIDAKEAAKKVDVFLKVCKSTAKLSIST